MAGVIDTNLLLYGANANAVEHSKARQFLISAGRSTEPWYLTEGILYEFLRVCTHPRVFPRPLSWREGLAFLNPFLESPGFTILRSRERHWTLIRDVLADLSHPTGNLFFDVRTAVLMREHGVRDIYTTDADFLQFLNVQVINPLKP